MSCDPCVICWQVVSVSSKWMKTQVLISSQATLLRISAMSEKEDWVKFFGWPTFAIMFIRQTLTTAIGRMVANGVMIFVCRWSLVIAINHPVSHKDETPNEKSDPPATELPVS
jgi:hypothetical protein